MGLFTILRAENKLLATNKFAFELLNRLQAAEPECAYYKLKQPLYNLYRPSTATDPVTFHLFTAINALVDLIHTAFIVTLAEKSKNQLKKIITEMFPRLKDHEIKTAIPSYVDACNDKIIIAFHSEHHFSEQLRIIESLLIRAFPTIDRERLKVTLEHMMVHLNQTLPSSSSTEQKNTADAIDVAAAVDDDDVDGFVRIDHRIDDLVSHSVFSRKSSKTGQDVASEAKSSCLIS